MKNFYVILMFLFIGCNSKSDKQDALDFYSSRIENLDINTDTEYVIVLPGLGCQGCIQEAELFMKNNISRDEYYFVLTKVESLKLLQQKTGINISEYENIYIDREMNFDLPSNNTIYPAVLKLENAIVQSLSFQSPENDIFSRIELER